MHGGVQLLLSPVDPKRPSHESPSPLLGEPSHEVGKPTRGDHQVLGVANVIKVFFRVGPFDDHSDLKARGLDGPVDAAGIDAALEEPVHLVRTTHNVHLVLSTFVQAIKDFRDTLDGILEVSIRFVSGAATLDQKLGGVFGRVLDDVSQSQVNHQRIVVWTEESLGFQEALVAMNSVHEFKVVLSITKGGVGCHGEAVVHAVEGGGRMALEAARSSLDAVTNGHFPPRILKGTLLQRERRQICHTLFQPFLGRIESFARAVITRIL